MFNKNCFPFTINSKKKKKRKKMLSQLCTCPDTCGFFLQNMTVFFFLEKLNDMLSTCKVNVSKFNLSNFYQIGVVKK